MTARTFLTVFCYTTFMENRESTTTPEATGKYTREERKHFEDKLGPGAAFALESFRKQVGIRIKVTRRGKTPNSETASTQD